MNPFELALAAQANTLYAELEGPDEQQQKVDAGAPDEMGEDWDWEGGSSAEPEAEQAPRFVPTGAEQLALQQRAAVSRHARERTERQPEAAQDEKWQSEAQRVAAQEQLAEQMAEERAKERTTQVVNRPSASVMADMIAKNHDRIRNEVARAIFQSGDNSLSKEGLLKAQQEAKNKANQAVPRADFGQDV